MNHVLIHLTLFNSQGDGRGSVERAVT